MEFIYGYIKNICIFMLVITIITNIFPEKRYIKYIKFFAGMLLILIVLSPVFKVTKKDIDVDRIIKENLNTDAQNQLDTQLNNFEKKIEERLSEKYGNETGNNR